MKRDRVFIDTNILLSGLIFEGKESQLLELALDDRIKLLLAEVVIEEARRVLISKFPAHVHVLDSFLNRVNYEAVPPPSTECKAIAARMVCDPADTDILASILSSSPDAALTGDKDLLTEEIIAAAPVHRCADYLREFLAR